MLFSYHSFQPHNNIITARNCEIYTCSGQQSHWYLFEVVFHSCNDLFEFIHNHGWLKRELESYKKVLRGFQPYTSHGIRILNRISIIVKYIAKCWMEQLLKEDSGAAEMSITLLYSRLSKATSFSINIYQCYVVALRKSLLNVRGSSIQTVIPYLSGTHGVTAVIRYFTSKEFF